MEDEIKKVLESAIQAEKDGFKTYSEAAKKTDKAEIRAVFNRLANDEIKHRRILETELELLTNPRSSFISLERETTSIGDLEEQLVAAESAAMTFREATEELVDYRERIEQELRMAQEVQARLLPRKMPRADGLDVSGRSVPARRVGGDYFDFSTSDGYLYVAVGDVMGKGLPAALLMATVRAAWKAEVAGGFNPPEILSLINEATFEDFSSSRSFVSFISGQYDEEGSVFSFANAGHPPPFHLISDRADPEEIITSDILIGIDLDAEFSSARVSLGPGDIILLYTDGLTDIFADDPDTIPRLLSASRAKTAKGIQEVLLREALKRTSDRVADDVTVVVIKKLPG
ncbi:MAG: SpoIIE family protein phosphatase [Candidatus Aquicultorales bacterium]